MKTKSNKPETKTFFVKNDQGDKIEINKKMYDELKEDFKGGTKSVAIGDDQGNTHKICLPDNFKTVFNVQYFDAEGEIIDSTQIDENSEDLAWELFEEFGHEKKEGYTVEFEEVQE